MGSAASGSSGFFLTTADRAHPGVFTMPQGSSTEDVVKVGSVAWLWELRKNIKETVMAGMGRGVEKQT